MRKDIAGYEGIYEVDTKGNIYSIKTERLLKTTINEKGYVYIGLNKNGIKTTYKIHRLVANAFIENPNEYPQIDHIDENKNNNYVNNLRWCTHQMNIDWHYENNPHKKAKPIIYETENEKKNRYKQMREKFGKNIIVDTIEFQSAGDAAKYIVSKNPEKKQSTISKELRRRHLKDGQCWLMYNKHSIGY